jgi:hypothetical protein
MSYPFAASKNGSCRNCSDPILVGAKIVSARDYYPPYKGTQFFGYLHIMCERALYRQRQQGKQIDARTA